VDCRPFYNLLIDIIAVATDAMILQCHNSSPTSASGIAEMKTHVVTMNNVVQPWYFNNSISGRSGMEYLLAETAMYQL